MWTSRILKRLSPLACSNTCAIRLSFLCANVAIIVFSGTGSTHPKFQSTVSFLIRRYLREICQLLAVLCVREIKMNWRGQDNLRKVEVLAAFLVNQTFHRMKNFFASIQ